jgi:hypothetical protein
MACSSGNPEPAKPEPNRTKTKTISHGSNLITSDKSGLNLFSCWIRFYLTLSEVIRVKSFDFSSFLSKCKDLTRKRLNLDAPSYCFSFGEDEFYAQNPEERLRMQFSTDPIWRGR